MKARTGKPRGPTANELLAWLPIVAGNGWRVLDDMCVRDRYGRCPLCALLCEWAGVPPESDSFPTEGVAAAAERAFGYNVVGPFYGNGVRAVMRAADFSYAPLRDELYHALGMS